MSQSPPFDVRTLPLTGRQLVEASAGTGKTHAIADLYVRLVAETDLRVEQILVLTFTRAATAELKGRIRRALVSARRQLGAALAGESSVDFGGAAAMRGEGPPPHPNPLPAGARGKNGEVGGAGHVGGGLAPALAAAAAAGSAPALAAAAAAGSAPALAAAAAAGSATATAAATRASLPLAPGTDLALARGRIEQALRTFDEAVVVTLHGLCQRALGEFALEAGLPFTHETTSDASQILQPLLADFWRRHLYPASPLFAAHVAGRGGRDKLLEPLLRYLGRAEVRLLQGGDEATAVAAAAKAEEAYRRAGLALLAACAFPRAADRAPACPPLAALVAHLAQGWPVGPALEVELRALLATQPREGESALGSGEAGCPAALAGPLDDWLATLGPLAQCHAALGIALAGQFIAEARQRGPALRRQQRRLTFDDLLVDLDEALAGPGGARFARRLRARYPAALIDEFQDTDPLQYRIFRRIYPDAGRGEPLAEGGEGGEGLVKDPGRLILVGDPKQAIYGFRGADVYAYLQASEEAAARHTLDRNWRSVPALVRGVNALFAGHPNAFHQAGIGYPEVSPAPQAEGPQAKEDRPALTEDGLAPPPLSLWLDPQVGEGVEAIRQRAQTATVAECARLLAGGRAGRIRLGGRALRGADIAILVRKNAAAQGFKEALRAVGIGAIAAGEGSLFQTEGAREVERLLAALLAPGDQGAVRAALATRLLGADATALRGDDEALAPWLDRLDNWTLIWRNSGAAHLLAEVQRVQTVAQRLLPEYDGERYLTNLLHLGERLASAEATLHLAPEALWRWLGEQRRAPLDEQREALLRLESDADLVQIVTVHKSKGLQYPVVFLPCAWEGLANDRDPYKLYHDPTAGHAATLCIDPAAAKGIETIRRGERFAEDLRLLYVALTRAAARLYVYCGTHKRQPPAALGWLLHPPPRAMDLKEYQAYMKKRPAGQLQEGLDALAAAAQGAIQIGPPPLAEIATAPTESVTTEAVSFVARTPPPAPHPGFRIMSYSGLVRGAETAAWDRGESGHAPVLAEPLGVAESLGMATEVTGAGAAGGDLKQTTGAEKAGAEEVAADPLPAGVTMGICLHAILEQWAAQSVTDDAGLQALIQAALPAHGLSAAHAPAVAALLGRVLHTPLPTSASASAPNMAGGAAPTWTLAGLPAARRRAEVEFLFPVGRISPGLLARLPGATGGRLRFAPAAGLVKGYIDLICAHAGRYYVIDYKSNWLGPSPADYGPEALARTMAAEHYTLQAQLYALALHRHLALRLQGYAFAQHFGGCLFLFLRGMVPAPPATSGAVGGAGLGGPATGIHVHCPTGEEIHRLGDLLAAGVPAAARYRRE
jgi:exodeoxyribonuclease V beta subunit